MFSLLGLLGFRKKIFFSLLIISSIFASLLEVLGLVLLIPIVSSLFDITFYLKFNEYASNHIIDFYLDYSYLKKRLEHEKLIHRIKDNDFMRFLFEDMKLINKKKYFKYTLKNGLSSLNKSTSINRENNFNNLFNND